MSDEKALLQHLACVVPESSWFFRGHLQHVAEYLSRAGLTLVPAAAKEAQRAHCGDHAGWRSDCDKCAAKEQGT